MTEYLKYVCQRFVFFIVAIICKIAEYFNTLTVQLRISFMS